MKNSLTIFPKEVTDKEFAELYEMVVKQLAKDFHPYSTLDSMPQELSAEWIYSEIKRMLSHIVTHENQALGYIIYRVDIPQKTIQSNISNLSGDKKLEKLAELILKREAQKVWIRKNYSS